MILTIYHGKGAKLFYANVELPNVGMFSAMALTHSQAVKDVQRDVGSYLLKLRPNHRDTVAWRFIKVTE